MGEGSSVLILEELEHAQKRGARIYAEVAGYGATGDAFHLTSQPEEHEGLQRSMKRALNDAGLTPADIDYVNAHGTSTPLNDSNEAKAIARVFGPEARNINISSTKSATGHMLGAAGATEFIAALLAIRDSIIPPTINLTQVDPECGDLNFTAICAQKRKVRAALSNSAGFGGHNVTLAVKRFED
jgi:3-oxoacyl-[acyl-carrier-protein] synthase II